MPDKLLIFTFFLNLFLHAFGSAEINCGNPNSSLSNFSSEFLMLQHQLRGVFELLNDCSFRVSEFDMLEGSDVHWWGSSGDDFHNLTTGFFISDFVLNKTYKNDSFVVSLRENLSLSEIPIISVWDVPTASDFGHVVLRQSEIVPKVHEQPTMFDNCKVLSKNFRVRWTMEEGEGFIDIGLEAATRVMNYMAFGWANPNSTSQFMLGSDVTVTGFTEGGMPFSDDFFITKYSECVINKDGSAEGVCPDTIFEEHDPVYVNNTQLVHGQRKDGVSLIRYRRPLVTMDKKFDLPVNVYDDMTVVWALGLLRPPDTLRPYYLPQTHGGPELVTFGHLTLNVSEHINDCFGPLDAVEKDDQDIVIADGKSPLIVTSHLPSRYPNPPPPSKVLYINNKESPILRVERGVPVTFSMQAGHGIALYITSDPIGGNATSRNLTEIIYAGGPYAQGVLTSPKELVWTPDRNTPDIVYYQSLYDQKMGWKVQVVDGGLPDMYNNSVVLDDHQVTFFWTLSEGSISMAVRAEKKSGYVALGFGSEMVNSFAYVGWVDEDENGHVSTYWIDGKDASSVHPTNENLTYVRCISENGVITFEFTRPLKPLCGRQDGRPECSNIIEPTTPLKVIWSMGARWKDGGLSEENMHSVTSKRVVRVFLMRGSAEAEEDLRPVLAVHGFMMFLAWGVLLPGGVLAARYLKHMKGDGWFQIHVCLQYSGLAITLIGFLFAAAELRGFHISLLHVKFATTAIILVCVQPLNAFFRPKNIGNGEAASSKRIFWEYFHIIVGRCTLIVGIMSLISGMKHFGDRYGEENVHGLSLFLMAWITFVAIVVMYLEHHRNRKKKVTDGAWVLGNTEEEDDSLNLLNKSQPFSGREPQASEIMEIQLEPLGR